MSIPKRIYVTWKDKNILETDYDLIINGVKNLKLLNPTWNVEVSDDGDVSYYLKNHLIAKDYNLVKDIGIVAKSDIWRLLKIYYEGGLYVDIDRYCNKILDNEIPNNIKWVLPVCDYLDFSQDIMCSESYNPAFQYAISFYFNRRYAGSNNIYFLGAQTYMHAITYTLLNSMVDSNPGKEKFQNILKIINEYNFIKTYVEQIPNDTFLYKGDMDFDIWKGHKKDLYKAYNLKHWSGEW